MDACVSDALARIASTTSAAGTYNLFGVSINCSYEISSISAGLITVTTTASSTSDFGYWQDQVIMQVNVSTTPISIDTYKTDLNAFASAVVCGDGDCAGSEDCATCSADCGACVCGDGVQEGDEACDDGDTYTERCGDNVTDDGSDYCNEDCTAVYAGGEVCDDNDTTTEYCGDGVVHNGTFCDATCSTILNLTESCDYTSLNPCGAAGTPSVSAVGCRKNPLCPLDCAPCTTLCF